MQQVMRFDYETDGFGDYLGMCMSDDGDYVYYDDYKTLAATVIEQQAEIERLRGIVRELIEMLDYDKSSVDAAYSEIDQ